jgi:O-acetylhomoserine (thiol)-lyase
MNFESSVSTPITSSAAFSYSSSEEAEAIFSGNLSKPLYSRMGNPTSTILEEKLAVMDGGIAAIATSSGMASISMSIMALCKSGDEIISIGGLFGGNYALLSQTLPRFGIKTTFLSMDEVDKIEENINDNTKIIFCESVGNPNLRLTPIDIIGNIANKHNVAFLIDNTTTAGTIKPIEYGADIVLYSTTKIISGNSSALGGAAILREIKDNDKFHSKRYEFLQPFIKKLKGKALYGCCKKRALRDFGMSASAYNSYQTLLGLETLELRNERIKSTCEKVSLELLKNGVNVNHPSLLEHCDNNLYQTLYKNGCGPVLTIDMQSKEKAFDLLNNTKFITLTANLGDSRTLALHMASTIYSDFTTEEQKFLGISEGLIRVSIGLENPTDIINDIMQAIN